MRKGLLAATALTVAALATGSRAAEAEAEAADSVQLSELVVIAPDRLDEIAGAATILDVEDYARAQPFTLNDVLRRAPGVFPRGEEGLALRPNIGFRGLNPTRSTEVLLLEDGVPLAYAPYGDNASYYHPPFERFVSIEVLKGASQIAFGPHTVGGVVNYVTPTPPEDFEGRGSIRIGERGGRDANLFVGDTLGGTGVILGLSTRRSDGVRANHELGYDDVFLKAVRRFGDDHELTIKASAHGEDSQVSYSGLTTAEFAADPFGNPFPNDRFALEHYAGSIAHGWRLSDDLRVTTVLYASTFGRDWWRQSSNSGQRPNDASDPTCGGMANLSTTCGDEGRLRQYYAYGIDSRLAWSWFAGDWSGQVDFGARIHHENQERFQWNGDAPWSRTPGVGVNGGVKEHNVRQADAASAFVQTSARRGAFTFSAGVRFEDIVFERSNKLAGARGESGLQAWIPGAGLAWSPSERLTVFAGVHKGFSPPRVEDVVSNAGGTVELAEEESVNYEIGVRAAPRPGLKFDATVFVMDFDNQIVPASVAGGVGSTLTSAGATRHEGLEASGRFSSAEAFGTETDWYLDGGVTWVATARYEGVRFSSVPGFGAVSVSGARLPYAPELFGRAAAGFETASGLQAEIEAVYTGEMFTDDLNTVSPTADGQRGRIDDVLVWNFAGSWRLPGKPVKLLFSVRNLADALYIVDRSRGILPGEPRTAQIGVEWSF